MRRGLRSFSIDAIQVLAITGEPTIEVDEAELNRELECGYAIFSGAATRQAVLRFSPQLARWVSRKTWQPQQQSEYDGRRYILRLPHSQDTELVMDVLKHGAEVEVLESPELRARVKQRIDAMRDLCAGTESARRPGCLSKQVLEH